MYKNYITYKTKKAMFSFAFFFLFSTPFFAQNAGTYKYINTYENCKSVNKSMLEIDNHYYLLSEVYDKYPKRTLVVTVFDDDLNVVKDVELDGGDMDFGVDGDATGRANLFYNENHFYVLGLFSDSVKGVFFAKYDEEFNLVQPISTYILEDTVIIHIDTFIFDTFYYIDTFFARSTTWYNLAVFMTKNNEFIVSLPVVHGNFARLLRIDSTGKLLNYMRLSPYGSRGGWMVETDSHYVIDLYPNVRKHPLDVHHLYRFCKDTLEKYELISIKAERPMECGFEHTGIAIAVGNHLIREHEITDYYPYDRQKCPHKRLITDRSIVFYNEDLSLKNCLILGENCAVNDLGKMHYINADSIYYAYETITPKEPLEDDNVERIATISIACFSSEGELHFNHTLDLPNPEWVKEISRCKVLSNGGVLVSGTESFGTITIFPDGTMISNIAYRGFVLHYRPNKDVDIREHTANTERKIFPNPAQTHFTVTNTANATLHLYNTMGQEVFSTYGKEENTIINVNTLPQGVYVLKVTKDGVLSTHKVVKR